MAACRSRKVKPETDSLQTALLKWATEEMKFHTSAQNSQSTFKMPSDEDFKSLCTGPLVDVWKYVIKHVKSVQSAKHIKGNVELKRHLGSLHARASSASSSGGAEPADSEEEKERKQILSQQHSRLSRELQQTKAEISQLHRELGHATEEISATELAYQSVCQRVRDLQCRESLLQVANNCGEETVARYDEYRERVEKCVRNITDKKKNDQENFISGSRDGEDEELETESCHMVGQVCDKISKFLHLSLDGSVEDSTLEQGKSDLLDTVSRAAAVNSTRSLVSALAMNTERDARRLREKTMAVDINKDALEISFTYDPESGLRDLSSPPSTTETVKQLLQASSEQHVLRWFKEQEHRNEEWKLSSRHTETIEELNKLLTRVTGDHPSHLAAVKAYVTACVSLAEEQAVVPCLKMEAARLRARIDHARQERQELQLKHAQIQDFQKRVGKKQAIISTLAGLNAKASERLDSHREQVESYLESRSLLAHLSEVQTLPTCLKGGLISELERFQGLLMPCLLSVPIDSHSRVCGLDLSISPALHALAYEKLQTYTDVGKSLEFPLHKSVECLLLHVLSLHTSLTGLHTAQEQRELTAEAFKKNTGTTDDISTFVGLRQLAEEHDQAQSEKLLPLLNESLEYARKHLADMPSLKRTLNTWWEQPAQWTTPWVKSEGLTYDQWMQRWTTAMTQAHTKLMSRRGNPRQ